jgi:hypothetical protein
MGDEFSKAFDFHQADLVYVHTHTHGRQVIHCTNSMWEWDKEILYVIYKLTQIYLLKIKLYLPLSLSWVAFYTEVENSHKRKHNVAGYTTKIERLRKVLWFMNKNTYVT